MTLLALGLLTSSCAGPGLPATMPADPSPSSTTTPTSVPVVPVSAPAGVPDITSVTVSTSDLLDMLPPGDTGVAGTDNPQTIVRTNEDLVSGTAGSGDDEAADVVRFGRITGVSATYPAALGIAHVWIDLLPDSSTAHSYLVDTTGDISKGLGGTHEPGVIATGVGGFPVDGVGEEAVGMTVTLAGGATETVIVFRVGRLVVFVSVERPDTADMRVAAQYLAEETEDRIITTLSGTNPAEPVDAVPAYRFAFERTLAWDGGQSMVSSEGIVDGTSVSCRVTSDGPAGRTERELVAIGSNLWFRDGSGTFTAVGSAATEVRGLLVLCPAWPLDISASGLEGALDDDPDRAASEGVFVTVHEATLVDLETVLGSAVDGVDLATFGFSVAEGTNWLAGVTLVADGPASQLRPLIGDVDAAYVSVTMRHSVSDLGDPDLRVVPPR